MRQASCTDKRPLDDADLTGLVADLGLHRHGLPAGVDRVDDRLIALLDDIAAQSCGCA